MKISCVAWPSHRFSRRFRDVFHGLSGCNSLCHQLGLTPFAHSPMPGEGAATEYRNESPLASEEEVFLGPQPHTRLSGKGQAQIYSKVPF